ncbi:hypothetical protein BD408DRAFT_362855 [Parasitella parasitica]|nr:hypothetical protein BD408DRAFT_362855 [Parasitella parasitica]
MLYGDAIYNINQDGRAALLQTYRESVSEAVQAFNAKIPVYVYAVDYFHETAFDLVNCLLHLQHRHSLCMSKSTLLTWSAEETKSLDQHDFLGTSCIYLQEKPLFNVAKWKYIHQSSSHSSAKDKLKYVTPDILQLYKEELVDLYRIPLLRNKDNELPLTKSEEISDNVHHTVSAKTLQVFDSWVELGLQIESEPIGDAVANPSSFSAAGIEPFTSIEKSTEESLNKAALESVIQALTMRNVKAFISNMAYIERATNLKDRVTHLAARTEDNGTVQMAARLPIENSPNFTTCSITFSKKNNVFQLDGAKCSCPIGNWGNCKHCAAVLLHALDTKRMQNTDVDHNGSRNESSEHSQSDSSLLTKRSYDTSEDGNTSSSNESRKKANSSIESYDSISTVGYDPDATSPRQASNSTDGVCV